VEFAGTMWASSPTIEKKKCPVKFFEKGKKVLDFLKTPGIIIPVLST